MHRTRQSIQRLLLAKHGRIQPVKVVFRLAWSHYKNPNGVIDYLRLRSTRDDLLKPRPCKFNININIYASKALQLAGHK